MTFILVSPIVSYIPHGHCYLWQTPLVSLHVISNLSIALAYLSIPITILYSINKRQDLPFVNVIVLFGTFIVLCGIGHLLDVWTLWHPNYWISGIERALTAIVSCYTAAAMITLIPQFLSLKSPEELAIINDRLKGEIDCRKTTERELLIANKSLEKRTRELDEINRNLELEIEARIQVETALRDSEGSEREKARDLTETLQQLKDAQSQLVQSEKMTALGKMIGGIAHEINNPITFIYGNVEYGMQYARDLLDLIELYQLSYPEPVPAIADRIEYLDLEFIEKDLMQLLESMKKGADRIRKIVLSLRSFSHLDEDGRKSIDLNSGIQNTLTLLSSSLSPLLARHEIEVIEKLNKIPAVNCYPAKVNQAILNLLENAIDAVMERRKYEPDCLGKVEVETKCAPNNKVAIVIQDNGLGIPDEIKSKIFDPFFTTKPIGQGAGLGLTTAYQIIVQEHQGELECISDPTVGTCFKICLPLILSS